MILKSIVFLALLMDSIISFAQLQQRSLSEPLPTRQIHLDFHTSGFISGVGEKFSKAQFQEALRVGHVNHINIFSKDHSGYSFYPTKVGTMHPNLKFNLLKEQMEACHEIGVNTSFYFTVGWSALDAEQHPEWCIHDQE